MCAYIVLVGRTYMRLPCSTLFNVHICSQQHTCSFSLSSNSLFKFFFLFVFFASLLSIGNLFFWFRIYRCAICGYEYICKHTTHTYGSWLYELNEMPKFRLLSLVCIIDFSGIRMMKKKRKKTNAGFRPSLLRPKTKKKTRIALIFMLF